MKYSAYEAKQVGAAFSNIFDKKRLTQKDLEQATGVNQGQISRFLAGKFRIWTANLEKLCQYAENLAEKEGWSGKGLRPRGKQLELGISVSDLLGHHDRFAKKLEDLANELRELRKLPERFDGA
jgi:transcriptional regulator with XRE-family HTH domain